MRILLLEDNPADAELIEYELRESLSDFVLKRVETEKEFLKELAESLPDLILSDYDLPLYNGALALADAKERCPDTPFILVTGAVSEDRAIEILTRGAKDYVLKTRLQQRLVPAVRRALEESKEHKARQKAERDLRESYALLEKRVAERTLELEKARLEAEREKSLLEAALEALPIGMAITDSAGGSIRVNQAFEQIWGSPRPPTQSIYDYSAYKAWWLETGKPVQPEEWASALAVEKGLSIYGQLMEIERFDGTRAIILNSASPVRDSKGNITGSAVSIQEITELHQARETIRQSQARLNWVLDTVGVGLWFNTLPLGHLNWDDETKRIFFLQPDREPTIELFWSRIHPDDREPTRLAVEDAIQKHTLYRIDHRAVNPDNGEIRWIHSAGQATYAEDGKPIRFDGINYEITERKQAEESLRRSEERFRSVFTSNVAALAIWDAQGHLLDANDRFLKLIGYTREEFEAGQVRWDEATPPEMRQRDYDAVEELKAGREIEPYEKEFVRPDGTRVPVIIGGKILPGTPEIGVAFAIEITDRKRTEKENKQLLDSIREEKDRLQALVNSISDEVWFADTEKRFTLANPSALQEFGLDSPSEIDVQKFAESLEVYRPDGSPRPAEEAPPLRALGGEVVRNEEEIIRTPARGELRYRQVSANPVRNTNGQIIGSVSIVRDITEFKQAEESSAAAHRQLQDIIDNTTSIIYAFDREERFLLANAALAELLNSTPEQMVGKRRHEFMPKEDADWHEANDRQVIETGRALEFEEYSQLKGLSITWLTTKFPLRDVQGKIYAVGGISVDLSERKQAEEKIKKSEELLREINKELESFSYTVSHDLQAPLRAIMGFSQMIMKDEAGARAETKRKLAVIQENAQRMQRLIEDLLSLARIGQQKLSLTVIDMDALVKDVWKELEAAYPDKPLKLKTKELHPAYGDQILIRQVLSNLLSNAIKYSADRKPIAVEVGSRQEDDGNVYYVKDKGVGFDMKYYDQLFGVFQRLHSASEYEGTGIGLSIAQRIIHLHGGKIWAEGKVDKGAVFYFMLPRERERVKTYRGKSNI